MLAHAPGVTLFIPSVPELLSVVSLAQGLNLFSHDVGTALSWSASDEFYIYLVFGLLCMAIRGRARLAVFAALALFGYAFAVWASLVPNECLTRGTCFFMTYSYGWTRGIAGFFAGALVAEFRDRAAVVALVSRVPQALAFAAALLLLLFADRVPASAFAAPFVFATLVAALSRDSGPAAHALLGAAFLLASFALAHVLHMRIETPCRQRINAWADTAFRSRSSSSASRSATNQRVERFLKNDQHSNESAQRVRS